jgi:hypothetical protein
MSVLNFCAVHPADRPVSLPVRTGGFGKPDGARRDQLTVDGRLLGTTINHRLKPPLVRSTFDTALLT